VFRGGRDYVGFWYERDVPQGIMGHF